MSDAQKVAFVNRFGTLQGVQRATARNGKPYVKGTLKSVNKAGNGFDTPFTAYNEKTMKAILEAGNGAFISLRGPLEQVEKDGGKYTETLFKAVMVNEKKAAAPAAESTGEASGESAPVAEGTSVPKVSRKKAAAPAARKIEDEIPF